MNKRIIKLSLLFLLFSVIACKDDGAAKKPLTGKWDLVYGELNGRESPALEGIFFAFNADTLTSNFNPEVQTEISTFSMSGDKFIQSRATGDQVSYQINNLSDTSLELSTALRGYDFRLVLKKTPPSVEQ